MTSNDGALAGLAAGGIQSRVMSAIISAAGLKMS